MNENYLEWKLSLIHGIVMFCDMEIHLSNIKLLNKI